MIGLIVAYHARSKPSVVLSVALGLLLGGAIGNLIDRIRYGYVVDFVDAGIGDSPLYTFNVADSAISVAILLLILLALFPALGGSGGPLRWLSGRAARPSGFARCASRTGPGPRRPDRGRRNGALPELRPGSSRADG